MMLAQHTESFLPNFFLMRQFVFGRAPVEADGVEPRNPLRAVQLAGASPASLDGDPAAQRNVLAPSGRHVAVAKPLLVSLELAIPLMPEGRVNCFRPREIDLLQSL